MARTLYKTYFSHDIYARQDRKIKNLLLHFRKESEDKARSALCVYWWIVEDMHADDYKVSDLEVYADDYRCDIDFLKTILNDFDLFRVENDCYISDRVLRNIEEMKEKAEKAKRAASKRWKGNGENPPKGEESEINIDDVFISEIKTVLEKAFPNTEKISKDNKQKIAKISEENGLKIEDWQKIFSNAARGQDFNGKTQKIALKTILERWDDILNDNYYLSEDTKKKEEQKQARQKAEKEEQQKQNKISLEEWELQKAEKEQIKTASDAAEYLNKYTRLKDVDYLCRNDMFKELKAIYPTITVDKKAKKYITE